MTTKTEAKAIVRRVAALDEEAAQSRRRIANDRAEAVGALADLVGEAEAARLLGVSRAAVWKARRRVDA